MSKLICFSLLFGLSSWAFAQKTADDLLQEASFYFQRNQLDKGLSLLDEALEADPNHQEALATRIYLKALVTDEFEQVIADCRTASQLEMNGSPQGVYLEVGDMLIENKRFDRAVELMDLAIGLFPDMADLYVVRGDAWEEQDDHQKAAVDYRHALALQADYEYALLQLADAQFHLDSADQALVTIDRLLEVFPASHYGYDTRSNFYAELGEHEKALADNQKALDLADSRESLAYYHGKRAFLYDDLDRAEEACLQAQKARLLGDQSAYMLLGRACPVEQVKSIELKPGSRLLYIVTQPDGFQYPFEAEIKEFGPQRIAFGWTMEGEDRKRSGQLSMDGEALQSAYQQFNYFSDGEQVELSDQTSVWVSKQVFLSLLNDNPTKIDTGSGAKAFQMIETGRHLLELGDDGKLVEAPILQVQSQDGTETLWILNDLNNPLIVAMDLGWKIQLIRAQ